jgi:hypothetical protein
MAFKLPPDSVLYPHRCTIYRPVDTINGTTGKIGAKTYTTVATGVLCEFQSGQSNHGATEWLVDEGDNMYTLDPVSFKLTADVQSGDILRQTTGPEVGGFWRVGGNAQIKEQFGQFLQVPARRLPKAAQGLS